LNGGTVREEAKEEDKIAKKCARVEGENGRKDEDKKENV
jgi:hypothetical protein